MVANSNAVNCTAVCNDLFSVSGFGEGIEGRKSSHRAQLQKTKGKASN